MSFRMPKCTLCVYIVDVVYHVDACKCTFPQFSMRFMVQREDDLKKEFRVYNRVKVLRQELDLSRHELADALGIGYRTLGYIERQDYTPSLELAWRISRFFDLPLEAVFSPEPFGRMSEELYGRRERTERGE